MVAKLLQSSQTSSLCLWREVQSSGKFKITVSFDKLKECRLSKKTDNKIWDTYITKKIKCEYLHTCLIWIVTFHHHQEYLQWTYLAMDFLHHQQGYQHHPATSVGTVAQTSHGSLCTEIIAELMQNMGKIQHLTVYSSTSTNISEYSCYHLFNNSNSWLFQLPM